MSEPFFIITNGHIPECGIPPQIRNDAGDGSDLVSYFESSLGDQWVFRYIYATGKMEVCCGDAGWEKWHKVNKRGCVPSLMMSDAERLWIYACWAAANERDQFRLRQEAK